MSDLSLRAMTNDHGFRVIAACTTDSVREVLARQKVSGELAHGLADLVTAAVLLRETMAPDIRVQGLLRGAGGHGQLVGDSFPDGGVRGLAQVKGDRGAFSMGPGAQLKMMRSLANGSLIEVLPGTRLESPLAYWLIVGPRSGQRPEIAAFCAWLQRQAQATRETIGEACPPNQEESPGCKTPRG